MDTTDETSYSLEDLSAQTGFETRVIRSFIEQGLMLGPSSLGRYARYSESHLTRLLAIKALKEKRGLKLSDVRQMLMLMSDAEVLALADTARGPDAIMRSSALDYIRSLNVQPFIAPQNQEILLNQSISPEQSIAPSQASSPNQAFPPNQNNVSPLNLRNQRGQQSQRQLPTGETWHRFQITPDVELSVRGIQSEQQLTRMQSIANAIRELLIGGQND